jgi:TPR repeat protein
MFSQLLPRNGFQAMNYRLSLVLVVVACAMVAGGQASALVQAQDIASMQRQAKAGNAEAEYELARAYYTGTGVAKDSKLGLEWLRKSAGQGHAGAEFALAVMYLKGEQSVSQNPHEAALWFRKAARQQNKPAQASLSQMLADGLISKQEANWGAAEPGTKVKTAASTATSTSKAFSLGEVEKGLQGGITCKRLAALVDKFKVDFTLTADIRQRLDKDGADDKLLTTISVSRRPL